MISAIFPDKRGLLYLTKNNRQEALESIYPMSLAQKAAKLYELKELCKNPKFTQDAGVEETPTCAGRKSRSCSINPPQNLNYIPCRGSWSGVSNIA